MQKQIFANRFGLAISFVFLSLFPANFAFAQKSVTSTAGTQGPQQVIVTNSAAQPVPMVGLIKDSDAPARKPLQTVTMNIPVPAGGGIPGTAYKVLATVPANQRLVIEYVSGSCAYIAGSVTLASQNAGSVTGSEYLPDMMSKLVSAPVKFYANPGDEVGIIITNVNFQGGYCGISVTGYYVNLP